MIEQIYSSIRNRNYNPGAGRFVSEDPVGIVSGDSNLYRYVRNNVFGFVDPYGLTQRDIDLAFKHVFKKYPNAKNVKYRVANIGEIDSNTAGYFDIDNNEVILSRDYLRTLNSKEAVDLLDTAFHEVLHSQNTWKIIGDYFTPGDGKDDFFHRQIYDQAILDTADAINDFLYDRKPKQCPRRR
ncbi:RHS repeat-associated core domain protein [Bacteriovorax sp. BAL6_X]|nr:RHS repeat-associated core domain protein [Bacteriovorax sp. BAL6_X]